MSAMERKSAIKELVAPDDFNLSQFLDAMVLVIGSEIRSQYKLGPLWHKLLKLRNDVNFFNLNPRIQLEALLLT